MCQECNLSPVVHIQIREDAKHMVLDRGEAHVEAGGDFGAFSYGLDDRNRARAHGPHRLRRLLARRSGGHGRHGADGAVRREPRLPPCSPPCSGTASRRSTGAARPKDASGGGCAACCAGADAGWWPSASPTPPCCSTATSSPSTV